MKNLFGSIFFRIYPKALALRHRHTLAYRLITPFLFHTPIERMLDYATDFAHIGQIKGDYLEFGSYEGYSASLAYHLSRRYGDATEPRLYCFDSFQGMPDAQDGDRHERALFKRGDLACDEATFVRNLKRRGVDMRHVTVVPGWYEDTLTPETKKRLPARKAAIILVDCDLYASAARVLDFITGYVQDGTIIIFDDWFLFSGSPERGEQRAFAEWLAKNPKITAAEYRKTGWHIASFILHVTQKDA